jgi:hypothetical protein
MQSEFVINAGASIYFVRIIEPVRTIQLDAYQSIVPTQFAHNSIMHTFINGALYASALEKHKAEWRTKAVSTMRVPRVVCGSLHDADDTCVPTCIPRPAYVRPMLCTYNDSFARPLPPRQ